LAKQSLLINVDELWLKGGNRPRLMKELKNHIKDLFKAYKLPTLFENVNQRFVVNTESEITEEILKALQKLPGIYSVIPASLMEKDEELSDIWEAVDKEVETWFEELKGIVTFKVEGHRSDKQFPVNSMEIERIVGAYVLKKFDGKLKVDVHRPTRRLDIKVLRDSIAVSSRKIIGLGGLPWGSSGHLITMLSGGFDSPVASYLMSKRGCKQSFIFFYAYPFVGEEVKDKILKLTSVLGTYQVFSKLYIVPFGDVQKQVSGICEESYRTILFRKMMVETSNILADRVKASALLTGDALGQVSSQTMGNISLIDASSRRPIFRPLVGFNKRDIIKVSEEIGTHEISVIPHDDACTLFAPKNPIIKPDKKYWHRFEEENDLTPLLTEALDKAEVFEVSIRGELTKI
jgi:thiamine biosynthesis protein ThiI